MYLDIFSISPVAYGNFQADKSFMHTNLKFASFLVIT